MVRFSLQEEAALDHQLPCLQHKRAPYFLQRRSTVILRLQLSRRLLEWGSSKSYLQHNLLHAASQSEKDTRGDKGSPSAGKDKGASSTEDGGELDQIINTAADVFSAGKSWLNGLIREVT